MDNLQVIDAVGRMRALNDQIRTTDDRNRISALYRQYRAIGDGLAEEFGRRHGWKRSARWIHPGQLGRRSNHRRYGRYSEEYGVEHSVFDHPYYYRDQRKPYRPAAIAVHLYNWPNVKPDVEALCSQHHIGYQTGWDLMYPSWWYPGGTELIVYTPGMGVEGT